MVSNWLPALFIVPTTAVSPSSMLRRVTMPSIGDSMIDLRHVVTRRRQAGLLLLDLLFARFDFLLPRGDLLLAALDLRLANGDFVLRALERLPRRQSVLPQVLLSLQVLL